jgi:endoplasmic reticulum protein 29
LAANPQIIVATVGVKDFGDKDNVDLAQRYKVVKEDYPVLLLFQEGSDEPFRYKVSNIYILFTVFLID